VLQAFYKVGGEGRCDDRGGTLALPNSRSRG